MKNALKVAKTYIFIIYKVGGIFYMELDLMALVSNLGFVRHVAN
ncbi:hypothetical protein [Paraclostridium bifermentans]|nr:hypothetical protein [Paraclostridium bifermentans]